MNAKEELAQFKNENGRLRQLLVDIFNELETVQGQVGIVETAVVNSDISTERYIVELSLMLEETKLTIADEFPDELSTT